MKSLNEIKDKVAQSNGFSNWRGKLEHEHRGLFEMEVLDRITCQVAEAYADQFAPKWISCKDKMPENYPDLINNGEDVETTKMVLIMTDTGSVLNNHRLKMQVGEKEWVWFMGVSDEKILFWTPFPNSLRKLPNG